MSVRLIALITGCVLIAGCDWDQKTVRSDQPVSAEEASKNISLQFPDTSHDVYYFYHAGGMQEMQLFVRFTVNSNVVTQAAQKLIADHFKLTHDAGTYASNSIQQAPAAPKVGPLIPMTWWNPGSITNGYFLGATNGRPLYVWVDLGNHTIYLCETD